jgi:hypothetical protein
MFNIEAPDPLIESFPLLFITIGWPVMEMDCANPKTPGSKVTTSSVTALFAAAIASRRLQSLSQTPSLVSVVFVTVKVAASEAVHKKATAMGAPRYRLRFVMSRVLIVVDRESVCYTKYVRGINTWNWIIEVQVAGIAARLRRMTEPRRFQAFMVDAYLT